MASSAKRNGVIVHLNVIPPPGLDKDSETLQLSCSGTFFDKKNGIVLTSGLIFTPLLLRQSDQHEDSYQCRKLNLFFSRHGDILKRNQFSDIKGEANIKSGEDELLDYIEGQCNIKVYIQKPESYDLKANEKQHLDTTGSKNLCSLSISGNSELPKKISKLDSDEKPWAKKSVNILAIWRCPALATILDTVMTQNSGWSLTDMDNKNENQDEDRTRNLLPFFALLVIKPDLISEEYMNIPFQLHHQLNKTLGPFLFSSLRGKSAVSTLELASKLLSKWGARLSKQFKTGDLVSYVKTGQSALTNLPAVFQHLKKLYDSLPSPSAGDSIFTVATPFGSLSPTVFLNSISKGILTNLAGENQVLLMTDARCVPGCEGGGIYLETQTEASQLTGIIIAPFCWRQNEWVGLTFAVNLRPLLASLFNASSKCPDGTDFSPENNPCSVATSEMADLIENIGLVKVKSRWGSAVLIRQHHNKAKLLLTCCHVVERKAGASVRVRFKTRARDEFSIDAQEIYCTPKGRVYDLAILEVNLKDNCLLPSGIDISPNFTTEGKRVLAVGHGLFDDHMHLPASVTSGIVSKILNKGGKQVLIQSTCAVHPGASGGALIDARTHQLCGIIVCNTKDAVCSASYPHINLSVPSTIILPVLNEYINSGDPKVLEQLHDLDPVISCYWQLGYNQIGKLQSKL